MYKVIGWTHYDNEKYPETHLNSNEMRDAIVAEIRANNYEFNGQDHEYHESCTPVLNNGKRICCSQRQWGGLMAYAYDIDDWDESAYLFFFLADIKNPKYPENHVDESAIIPDLPDPKPAKRIQIDDEDYEEFEYRKFCLSNLSVSLKKLEKYPSLPASFDNNAAFIADLLMDIEEDAQNQDYSSQCLPIVADILSYWLTEDRRFTKDPRLAHLEKKFEGKRVEQQLSELCPPKHQSDYEAFDNDLLPCLYFLMTACPNETEVKARVRLHLHNLFKYSYLYQIDVNSDIPAPLLEKAMDLLKAIAR